MKIQPVGEKILVTPLPSNISSVLEVPEYYLTSEAFGTVKRLGTYFLTEKGKKILTKENPEAWPFKVGDKISFSNVPDAAKKLEEDGEEVLLMHISQVHTVIEN